MAVVPGLAEVSSAQIKQLENATNEKKVEKSNRDISEWLSEPVRNFQFPRD
jgi:hypothetical protein